MKLSSSFLSTAIGSVAVAGLASARTFTVYNACPFTIWPAVFTDLNVGTAVPSVETGWEAPAWSVRTFSVPSTYPFQSLAFIYIGIDMIPNHASTINR